MAARDLSIAHVFVNIRVNQKYIIWIWKSLPHNRVVQKLMLEFSQNSPEGWVPEGTPNLTHGTKTPDSNDSDS